MKIILTIVCSLLLLQCTHRVDTSDSTANNFIFRNTHAYYYTYDSDGRLFEERRVSYFKEGSSLDSTITTSTHLYDEKDRYSIIKEKNESEGLLSTKIFSYNESDSLISAYTVNNFGDTIYLEVHSYDKEGKSKFSKIRNLFDDLSLSTVERVKGKKIIYDTLTMLIEESYQDGLRQRTVEMDKFSNRLGETHHEYQNGKLSLVKVYEYTGSDKNLMATVFMSPPSNRTQFERLTVNFLGDTTAFTQVESATKGNLLKRIEGDIEQRNILVSNFNEEGQLITQEEWINNLGMKIEKLYIYDSLGRKVKMISIAEPLTEEEKNALTTAK